MSRSSSVAIEPKRRLWSMRRLRSRRPHRPRRRLPNMSVLPTLCTLGNLICGFAAIFYASREPNLHMLWRDWTPLTLAAALIFLGMFLDAIDGSLARLTNATSELGAQLDSLADVVTFGVAPAFITLRLVANHIEGSGYIFIGPEADNLFGKVIWGAAAVYVCCAALRLARFNVEMDNDPVNDHSLFRGLPSPGAAGTVASLVILHQHLLVTKFDGAPVVPGEILQADAPLSFVQWAALGIPLIMLCCAFGMVSNIPYIHMTNRYVRGPRSFHHIVRLVIVLALAVWFFRYVLAIAFTAYALSGPAKLLWSRVHRRPATPPATPTV